MSVQQVFCNLWPSVFGLKFFWSVHSWLSSRPGVSVILLCVDLGTVISVLLCLGLGRGQLLEEAWPEHWAAMTQFSPSTALCLPLGTVLATEGGEGRGDLHEQLVGQVWFTKYAQSYGPPWAYFMFCVGDKVHWVAPVHGQWTLSSLQASVALTLPCALPCVVDSGSVELASSHSMGAAPC
jgi:hypothetical protein